MNDGSSSVTTLVASDPPHRLFHHWNYINFQEVIRHIINECSSPSFIALEASELLEHCLLMHLKKVLKQARRVAEQAGHTCITFEDLMHTFRFKRAKTAFVNEFRKELVQHGSVPSSVASVPVHTKLTVNGRYTVGQHWDDQEKEVRMQWPSGDAAAVLPSLLSPALATPALMNEVAVHLWAQNSKRKQQYAIVSSTRRLAVCTVPIGSMLAFLCSPSLKLFTSWISSLGAPYELGPHVKELASFLAWEFVCQATLNAMDISEQQTGVVGGKHPSTTACPLREDHMQEALNAMGYH